MRSKIQKSREIPWKLLARNFSPSPFCCRWWVSFIQPNRRNVPHGLLTLCPCPGIGSCRTSVGDVYIQCVSMCIFHAFPAMPSDNWFRTKKRTMFGNFWIRMSRCPRRQLFSLRNPCVSSLIRVSSDRIRRINEISQHSESEICWGFECMDASPEWVWENSATTVPCLHQNLTVKLLRFFHESSCVIELGRFPRIPESRPHGHLGRGRVLSSNFMCIIIYIHTTYYIFLLYSSIYVAVF